MMPRTNPPTLAPSEKLPRIVPTEDGSFMTTHEFLSVPGNDGIIAVSQSFLDAMCPLKISEEFYSAFTRLPAIMPCQVTPPPALGNRARVPELIL